MHADSAIKGEWLIWSFTIDGISILISKGTVISFTFISQVYLKQVVRNYTEWLLAIKDYSRQKPTQ